MSRDAIDALRSVRRMADVANETFCLRRYDELWDVLRDDDAEGIQRVLRRVSRCTRRDDPWRDVMKFKQASQELDLPSLIRWAFAPVIWAALEEVLAEAGADMYMDVVVRHEDDADWATEYLVSTGIAERLHGFVRTDPLSVVDRMHKALELYDPSDIRWDLYEVPATEKQKRMVEKLAAEDHAWAKKWVSRFGKMVQRILRGEPVTLRSMKRLASDLRGRASVLNQGIRRVLSAA